MTQKDHPNPTAHPLWGILLLALILSWVTFTLWLNASKFDSTEGKAVSMIAGPLLAGWGIWFWRHHQTK